MIATVTLTDLILIVILVFRLEKSVHRTANVVPIGATGGYVSREITNRYIDKMNTFGCEQTVVILYVEGNSMALLF